MSEISDRWITPTRSHERREREKKRDEPDGMFEAGVEMLAANSSEAGLTERHSRGHHLHGSFLEGIVNNGL